MKTMKTFGLGLLGFCIALGGCGLANRTATYKFDNDPRCKEAVYNENSWNMIAYCGITPDDATTILRLNANLEFVGLQSSYRVMNEGTRKDSPGSYPYIVAIYVLTNMSITATGKAMDNHNLGKPALPVEGPFTDEIKLRHDEGREYLAFMKSAVARWVRKEISWEEADYSITAKGNEINKRFDDEFARNQQAKELKRQTRALENLPRPVYAPPLNCESINLGRIVETHCR